MASKQDQVLDGLRVKFAQLECQPGDNVALVRSLDDLLESIMDLIDAFDQRQTDAEHSSGRHIPCPYA